MDKNIGSRQNTIPIDRIYIAVSGKIPDRVPVVPKMWIDLAAIITDTDFRACIEDPMVSLKVLVDAGKQLGLDGVRQFHIPPRKTKAIGNKLFEVDKQDNIIGEIDLLGGFKTQLIDDSTFSIEDPVQTAFVNFYMSSQPKIKNISDVKRLSIPQKKLYEEMGCGKRQRVIIQEIGDEIALIGDCCTATMSFYTYMRGMNNALFDLIDHPMLVHAVMNKGVEFAVEKGKFNIDMGIKVLRLNDSVGNMNVISPLHWKEFVFPYIKEVCNELHRYEPKVRIYSHICGNILPIAELLADSGLDCIGPLDPLGGSTCREVRKRVGDKVALMGGVDTLSFVNKQEIDIINEARSCILDAGQKGGYLLSSGCVLPRTSRVENIKALNIAVSRFGIYENGRIHNEATC